MASPPLFSDAFLAKFKDAVKDVHAQPVLFLEALRAVSSLPNGESVMTKFVDTLITSKSASSASADAKPPPRKKIGVLTPARRKELFMKNFAKRVHDFVKDPETFGSLPAPSIISFTDINALLQVKNFDQLATVFVQAEKMEEVGNILVFESLLTRALILHGMWTLGKEEYEKFTDLYKHATGKVLSERTSRRARALLTSLFFPYPRLRHLSRFISWTAFGDNCEEILRYFSANPELAQVFANDSFEVEVGSIYKQEALPIFDQIDELAVVKTFHWEYDYYLVDQMEDEVCDEDPELQASITRYENLPADESFIDNEVPSEGVRAMTLV